MKVSSTPIEGLLVIEPSVFRDDRGYFFEPFNDRRFHEATGLDVTFVQDNESLSKAYTVRGLHFQEPPVPQGKLVRVSRGKAFDVAVDLRKESPTFGQHHMVLLSEENKLQFWIPPGFAHGFLTLEDDTVFSYKCTGYYAPECERTLRWNDPILAIDWGVEEPLISEKDADAPGWTEYESPF
ncbi:dTDP-4-dehydrorhamnose 3,5-epimerase [Sanyastnella coralliicola]|uniref:dTDP-4-dehydrorhamnose 3,5-epimerase n=1 Tax=Sanyastnella coralliicola TaxID=3069118 RepID=UPI0027B9AF78|nr:dTDP-4-dehydrorhamnose 3,5-epimerase [Longitalea sp. SCSIO 12813]